LSEAQTESARVTTRLRELVRLDRVGQLPFYSDIGKRRGLLHCVCEEDPAASAAHDALGEGSSLALDSDVVLSLYMRIARRTEREAHAALRASRLQPSDHLMLALRNQIEARGGGAALNALSQRSDLRGRPIGKLRPPRTVVLWLLADACLQAEIGARHIDFERDMRSLVANRNFGLDILEERIRRGHQRADEYAEAYGRETPIRPPAIAALGIEYARDWLKLFESSAPLIWPSDLGSVAGGAKRETPTTIAEHAALGAFATIMAALIKPPRHEPVGEVFGYALPGLARRPFSARVVRHHYHAFLEARGFEPSAL
jgi:hypothetical protein